MIHLWIPIVRASSYRQHTAPCSSEREGLQREIITQAQVIGSRAQDVTEEEFCLRKVVAEEPEQRANQGDGV